jgi:hypothetical protein
LLHFLPRNDGVVTCTRDPTAELVRELLLLCHADSLPIDTPVDVHSELTRVLASAGHYPESSGSALIDALATIASYAPGKLTIVIDQAEEVFTRAASSDDAAERAFFLFLESVYRRDLDIRIIIALRTEYYGRFRDALVIGDRSLVPPGRGGIEPYMLHSLRDRNQLKAILLAPTQGHCRLSSASPSKKYCFYFAPELPDRIVDDLLETFPHSSVLPPLQLVGTRLYREVSAAPEHRRIEQWHYDKLQGVTGVVDSYIDDGLSFLKPIQHPPDLHPIRNIISTIENLVKLQWLEKETVRWRRVLCSLVGRRGGGTVVSLSVTEQNLVQLASREGLKGKIGRCLMTLTQPPYPLLRVNEELTEDNRKISEFSLQHDTVALALDRWKEGQDKIKTKDDIIRRLKFAMVSAMMLFFLAVIYFLNDSSKSREVELSISKMDAIALDSGPDFRRRLLVLRASLLSSEQPSGPVQRLRLPSRHDSTLQELRKVLVRAPAFAATNLDAVGMDPTASQVVLLKGSIMQIFNLNSQRELTKAFTAPVIKSIPQGQRSSSPLLAQIHVAVGFLGDLRVAAVKEGMLFVWSGDQVKSMDLASLLPENLTDLNPGGPLQVEFSADGVQIMIWSRPTANANSGLVRLLYLFRLSADTLQSKTRLSLSDAIREETSGPPPVFAQRKNSDGSVRFAEARLVSVLPVNSEIELAPRSSSDEPGSEEEEVDIEVRSVDASQAVSTIVPERMMKEVHPRTFFGPTQRPFAFGFADNGDMLVFRHTDGRIKLFPIPRSGVSVNAPVFSGTANESVPTALLQPDLPFHRPLIAAAKASDGWRFAWPTEGGIELQRQWGNQGNNTNLARLNGSPLLSGQLGGIRLRFNESADFLVLTQQRTWNQPISIRIWDLDQSRESRIMQLDDKDAETLSCRVASFEALGGSLTRDETLPYGISDSDGTCQ